MNRRQLLGGLGALLGGAAVGGVGGAQLARAATYGDLGRLRRENKDLRSAWERLARSATSGGGVNVKMMPDPASGQPTVPLEEVFSFNHEHAICRVDTNPKAFRMKTHKLGEVLIQPHEFFMAMIATTIDRFHIETVSGSRVKLTMEGGLNCITEVAQASTTFGSRSVGEPADYRIEAVDAGVGGGRAGDSFAFTAVFDANKAPVNYAIFGPESTFTGTMVSGKITIVDPGSSAARR
jgi:hypothetical protein